VGRNHGLNGSTFLLSSEGVLFTVVPPATATEIDKQLESSLVDGSTIMVTGVFVGKVDEQQTTRQEASHASNRFRFFCGRRAMWSFSAFPPGGVAAFS